VTDLPPTDPLRAGRAAAVQDAFRSMPERYLGAPPGFKATCHFALGDIGRTWEVRLTEQEVRVREGASGTPDATIGTDAETWLDLVDGETSVIEGFFARSVWARGDLDLALAFEGLFRRPDGSPPIARIHRTGTARCELSALTLGSGPDVVLLHGLGSSKVSFFDTAAALSRDYRVHAIDLPGFGSSAKPAAAGYDARYFADAIVAYLDAEGIGSAHLVGNSMGGRVALEVALTRPERARTVALLCPAVAFVRRQLHPLVRLARPELGALPHRLHRGTVERQFWRMFADPDTIDPHIAQIAVDEFQRIYRSPRARYAFLSAARNIYLDAPFGDRGFYPRLAGLQAPALFVWGSHDPLIPASFARHVEQWLPGAEQIVLDGCGHVPQIERPAQTIGLLRRQFGSADALQGAARAPQRFRRAARASAA
jgi:pimeloyl-ACP methyl ester carboxylesterase